MLPSFGQASVDLAGRTELDLVLLLYLASE